MLCIPFCRGSPYLYMSLASKGPWGSELCKKPCTEMFLKPCLVLQLGCAQIGSVNETAGAVTPSSDMSLLERASTYIPVGSLSRGVPELQARPRSTMCCTVPFLICLCDLYQLHHCMMVVTLLSRTAQRGDLTCPGKYVRDDCPIS